MEANLKYLIFLTKTELLYTTALSIYDLQLALQVANQSDMVSHIFINKDPKEYLPFIKDLKQLDEHNRKFKIDHYLKRYDLALEHFYLASFYSIFYF